MKKLQTIILLLCLGFSMAHADSEYWDGDLIYRVLSAPTSSDYGTVTVTGLTPQAQSKSTMSLKIPAIIDVPDGDTQTYMQYQVVGVSATAFRYATNIYDVTMEYGVQYIAANAFQGCTQMVRVRMPSSVTTIAGKAFAGCTALTDVYIASTTPPSDLDWDATAFSASTQTKLHVAKGNTSGVSQWKSAISSWSTYFTSIDQSSLAYDFRWYGSSDDGYSEKYYVVTKPAKKGVSGDLTLVGVASNAPSLTENGNPHAVAGGLYNYYTRSVAPYACYQHATLTKVDLSATTLNQTIGQKAFAECPKLKTVLTGGSKIGLEAFYGNSALSSLTLRAGIQMIESQAFAGCKLLKSITIPSTATSVNSYFVDDCEAMTAINVATGNTAYSSKNGVLYNKAQTYLLRVPCGHTTQTFEFPGTLKNVGSYAFENCKTVKRVFFNYGIGLIGTGAFKGCSSLEQVHIPSSIKTLGNNMFQNCTSLSLVSINARSAPSINASTFFQGAKSPIDNLFVPRSQVANYIAAGWSGFSAINQDSKTSYDYAGFTTNISDLALAYTVTDPTAKTVELVPGYGIGGIDQASTSSPNEGGGTVVQTVRVPEIVKIEGVNYTLNSVDEYTFAKATNQFSMELPTTVKRIKNHAFAESGIVDCLIKGVTTIDEFAFYNSTLSGIQFSPDLNYIGDNAFEGVNVKEMVLPYGVTSIGNSAFANSKIEKLVIPSSVEYHALIFNNMTMLKNLYFNKPLQQAPTEVLKKLTSLQNLYVPVEHELIYCQSDWKSSSYTISRGSYDFAEKADSKSYVHYSVTSTTPPEGTSLAGTVKMVYNPEKAKCPTNLILSSEVADDAYGGTKRYQVTKIADDAFHGCTSKLIYSNGLFEPGSPLKSIGDQAFRNCKASFTRNVTEDDEVPANLLYIPESTTSIGAWAFADMSNLDGIFVSPSTQERTYDWVGFFSGNDPAKFTCWMTWEDRLDIRGVFGSNTDSYGKYMDRIAPYYNNRHDYDTDVITTHFNTVDYQAAGLDAYLLASNGAGHLTPTKVDYYSNPVLIKGLLNHPENFIWLPLTTEASQPGTNMLAYALNSFTDLRNISDGACYYDREQAKFVRPTDVYPIKLGRPYLRADDATVAEWTVDFFKRGDVNLDNEVSVADITSLVNIVLTNESPIDAVDFPSADLNGDGEVGVADVTSLVNLLLEQE